MAHSIKLGRLVPKIGPNCRIAGIVIGQVDVGQSVIIGTGAVLRGDVNAIRVNDNAVIGPNVVVHVAKYNPAGNSLNTSIGSGVWVDAGAVLHACTIESNAIVGPGAIILDGAVVESGAVVLPGTMISPFKRVLTGQVWGGLPGKLQSHITPESFSALRVADTIDWSILHKIMLRL